VRRKAGVSGEIARKARRAERVRAMTGAPSSEPVDPSDPSDRSAPDDELDRVAAAPSRGPEFPPSLDLIAPSIGLLGLVAAGIAAGDPAPLSVARVVIGALFLGAVSDAMLLGHWYLVQPGLARRPLLELVRWTGWVWPAEILVLLWPVGMASVWTGSVDDGWGGTLGWFWVACALTTLGLVFVTRAALRERYYSAVMAATGLLYLAILTAFGTDLVARAVLAS